MHNVSSDLLPAGEMPEERYSVSLALNNRQQALQLAKLMYADKPDLQNLDRLTWQLIQNGQSKEAARLLLQRYPFSDDENATTQTLMVRLGQLLESLPSLATPLKLASLTQPLSSPALRQLQSQFRGIADNCEAVRNLLGDMSPSYDATARTRTAQCYRDDFPGLSLYAATSATAKAR